MHNIITYTEVYFCLISYLVKSCVFGIIIIIIIIIINILRKVLT